MQQLGQQPVLHQGQRLVQQKVIQSQPQHSSLRDSGGGDGEGQAQQQPLQRGGLSQRRRGRWGWWRDERSTTTATTTITATTIRQTGAGNRHLEKPDQGIAKRENRRRKIGKIEERTRGTGEHAVVYQRLGQTKEMTLNRRTIAERILQRGRRK